MARISRSDKELCHAAAEVLGELLGGRPEEVTYPDEDSSRKRVDMRCTIGGRVVWLEHTVLMPLLNKVQDDRPRCHRSRPPTAATSTSWRT
jgi:hypothetical protein